ncbi:unnamed protein product [Allacma fusca]|uniref:Integrase catalytic domain-containing protein n=1 Tax=Allacma fusca TaxID=39272 RepID=A0A8J2J3G4_9HEXA|nr:unnamed protein product [Allacma fusca]
MADLPAARVTPSRPFTHTGVDYAGPVTLRSWTKRGPKQNKAYIVVFVCFASKAVHLDLATDLTSGAFLAAFTRFVSRRGKPLHMYSDNGGNFVAANKELAEMYELVRAQHHNTMVTHQLAEQGIQWSFNPPSAPHMGGLWEATVKSCKFHLKRVLGPTPLTYEEYSTFLAQVEACLNSRPMWKTSGDHDEASALTPGHFLIGAPLMAIPEPDLKDLKTNTLDRWQHIQQMTQHFWARWSSEYLQQLQKRTKWDTVQ